MEQKIKQECRKILYLDWDPIGVQSFCDFNIETDTEYEGYLSSILSMLSQPVSEKELEEYLHWAVENMGLEPNESTTQVVITKLLKLKNNMLS